MPLSGPLDVPLTQLEVVSHQPQPASPVQLPQVVDAAHGSGVGQELPVQLHAPQLPVLGPDEVPFQQAAVSAHQPQSSCEVQPPQSVCAAQLVAVHSELSQLQSVHEPLVGPLEVPP